MAPHGNQNISCRIRSTNGFGLVEVLIAVAVIAGVALLVANFISTSSKQQVQIREKNQCESTMSSIISKLKETDNNTIINNWLPKSNEGYPTTTERYLTTRMSKMIFNNFTTAEQVMTSTVLANVGGSIDGPYTAAENNLKLTANNYQLIYSTSALLAYYYRNTPNICQGVELNRDGTDYLSDIFSDLGSSVKVFIKLNVLNSSTCSPWEPVPEGVQAPTSGRTSLEINLRFTYPTERGEESCSGNATFYAGSDLQPPQLNPQLISAVSGFNELPPSAGDRIFCGPNASPALTFNVSQLTSREKPGVQYLCRLDYEGRHASTSTVVHPFRSTGWFLCSIPERPIEAMPLPGGTNLDVLSTNVSDGNQPAAVQFIVSNWVEGTYKFHVKAIDLARNETMQSQKFFIDTSRPTLNLTPPNVIASITDPNRRAALIGGISGLPNVMAGVVSSSQRDTMRDNIITSLGNRLYQCTNDFSPWTINNTEALEVTSTTIIRNYHAGSMPILISCDASSQSIPTTPWSNDGPHMVQAIACDLCGNGNPESATWYVDTAANFNFTPPGNLASQDNSFTYNAGPNDQNPYALVHEVYGSRSMTAQVYQGSTLTFPAQAGIGGACSPNRRGRYCYYAADGCGRIVASPSETYAVGGGGGTTHFCPTFSCTEPPVTPNCPAARPYACTCTNDSPRDLNLSTTRAGRYAGDPANPGCTYEENIGVCCRPPRDCSLEDGTPVAHGASITAYQSPSVSCGQSCQSQTRTCTDGVLSGSSSYRYPHCSVSCCPTGRVPCAQGSPGCGLEANGMWCAPEDQCPTTHPQGPFSTAAQCASAGNIDCQSFGSLYCGKQSVGSCSAGETECTCGSGGGCPTNPTNGICCKPAGPCTAGPYALTEWDPVNNDITCPSGQIRVEPPSSYTQTRSCKDASGNTADASCCGATLLQNATYYSSCQPDWHCRDGWVGLQCSGIIVADDAVLSANPGTAFIQEVPNLANGTPDLHCGCNSGARITIRTDCAVHQRFYRCE